MDTTLDSIGSVKLLQHKRGYRFSVDAVLLAAFVSLIAVFYLMANRPVSLY